MGIYDRDYYRGDSDRMFGSLGRWSAVTWIIVVTAGVFVLQLLTRGTDLDVTRWGIYDYRDVTEGQLWRLVTPIFLHDPTNLFHVFFNMLTLYFFGRAIEEKYGSRELICFYLVAGVVANLGNFLAQAAGMPRFPSLGASGAVTAVLVLCALNYPRQQVLLFMVLPVPLWALAVLFVVMDVMGLAGMRQAPIAFLIHLLGALSALLYYQSGIRLTSAFAGSPGPRTVRMRPRLRVVPQEQDEEEEPERITPTARAVPDEPAAGEEPLESKLDRVLEKVSLHGQESLSREEREILFRASEVYKKRRK